MPQTVNFIELIFQSFLGLFLCVIQINTTSWLNKQVKNILGKYKAVHAITVGLPSDFCFDYFNSLCFQAL